jgi:hypothetical protein
MGDRILLVEGPDDQHVLLNLCARHAVPQTFVVEVAGNDREVLRLLRSKPKASNLERLAVILDADTDIERRWGEARGALFAAGYRDVPERPSPGGTIVHGPNVPPAGLWLMPDNRLPGILEDFLAFLVPTEDALLPLVDVFLDGIPGPARRFAAKDRSKARIHAWLAAQEQPGKPLGLAIKARYLDVEAAAVAPFLSWLRATLVD